MLRRSPAGRGPGLALLRPRPGLPHLLALAAFVAVGGRLADGVNPVRLFAGGVIGFTLASAFAGAAPSGNWLIAGRALQGVAAAAMLPASLTIVVDAFPPGERGRAVGLRASLASVFLLLGPVIGRSAHAGAELEGDLLGQRPDLGGDASRDLAGAAPRRARGRHRDRVLRGGRRRGGRRADGAGARAPAEQGRGSPAGRGGRSLTRTG